MTNLAAGISHLGQKCLDHQVHATHVDVHGEVPVLLLTVQDCPMMNKTVKDKEKDKHLSTVLGEYGNLSSIKD